MANELIYHAGGRLTLDEPWAQAPSAATLTLLTMQGTALSNLGAGFTDVNAQACQVDDLVITLGDANPGAKSLIPSATAGTIGDLTDANYRLLLNRGGRRHYLAVDSWAESGGDITSIRFDPGIPFAIKTGDTLSGLRITYDVDWSSVTGTYTGKVQAIWRVTVAGVVHVVTRVYDVVKQVLNQPATWAHVLELRPDAADHMSNVTNKEALVTKAWDTVVQDLFSLGIRYNLILPDGSTTLRDATVLQCVYNLTVHQNLPVPRSFENQGDIYLDRLNRDRERCLGQLSFPVDENQDGIISPSEIGRNRRAVYFRSTKNRGV